MNEVKTTAQKLKNVFEEYFSKSDAVQSGYFQNRKVIEAALSGEEIEYHLCTVNLGCIRALQDSWDLDESEFHKVLSALSNFDEALKKQYGREQK